MWNSINCAFEITYNDNKICLSGAVSVNYDCEDVLV